jgi:hypothetical protein
VIPICDLVNILLSIKSAFSDKHSSNTGGLLDKTKSNVMTWI